MIARSRGSSGVIERTDRLTATRTSRPPSRQRSAWLSAVSTTHSVSAPDDAGLLGRLDELLGREVAALGVRPAHQRLDRAQPPRRELDLRLEDQLELAGLDRAAQLGDERQPLDAVLVELARVDDRVAVRGLRPLERDVGVAQQRVVALAVLGMAGDPDVRRRRRARRRGSSRARAARRAPARRRGDAAGDAVHRREDQGELVAAEPRGDVARARRSPPAGGRPRSARGRRGGARASR